MKLTLNGIKDRQDWEQAGIGLPSYDAGALAASISKTDTL